MQEDLVEHVPSPEAVKLPILNFLRKAIETENLGDLRIALNNVKQIVEQGGMQCAEPRDFELQDLLKTGKLQMHIGTGTSGQRIYVGNGELYMPCHSEKDAEYGRRYHSNFRYLFGLAADQEMRVRYK